MSSIQRGQFEFVSNPGVAITSFTQQDIAMSKLVFKHNGDEFVPAFSFSTSRNLASKKVKCSVTSTKSIR